MTIPNLITTIRVILTPIFIIYLLSKEQLLLFSQVGDYIFWITGALTISSGLHYMRYWFGIIGEEPVGQ